MNAPAYDHASALTQAFGITDARWFLGKARRDMARFGAATQDEERTDALLDFCASLISLEDWGHRGPLDRATWKAKMRAASAEHTMLALVALIAKHRQVGDGRFSQLRLEATDRFRLWTEDATPAQTLEWILAEIPQASIVHVRTAVEDDLIEGYDILIEVAGLRVNGVPIPIPTLMRRALAHWDRELGAADPAGG